MSQIKKLLTVTALAMTAVVIQAVDEDTAGADTTPVEPTKNVYTEYTGHPWKKLTNPSPLQRF